MEKFTRELESMRKNPLGIPELKNITTEINFNNKFNLTHYMQNIIKCTCNI